MTNAIQFRDEVEESLTTGELPEQGGGAIVPTVLPGIHTLRLPANLDQLWDAKDLEKRDSNGNVVMGADGNPVLEQHFFLSFDKDNPLIVVGGDFDGLPVSANISTLARLRGKKTDANRPRVADMTYLLQTSLNDKSPIRFRKDFVAAVNRHAGEIIRIESGLQAQCSSERVRYIDDGTGRAIEDPDGTKGCDHAAGPQSKEGSRLYSQDFKIQMFRNAATGETFNSRDEALQSVAAMGLGADQVQPVNTYSDRAICKNCVALLRGFFRIEKFLPPLASTQQR